MVAISEQVGVEALEWEVRLGEKMKSKRIPVVLVMVVVSFIGFFLMGNILAGIIGPLVVFVSTAEMFLPIRYRIDDVGLSQKIGFSRSLIEWKDVRRTAKMEDGIRLLSLEKASRMDVFRGVTARFSGNEAEVLAKIAELLANYGRSLDGRIDGGGRAGDD